VTPRHPLPPSLGGQPFRVRTGEAAGLGRGRLSGPDLARPFHGVREARPDQDPDPADVAARLARSYLPLLRPEDRFSHSTAAHLWPLPLPRGLDELHVSTTRHGCRPRSRGVTGHESSHGSPVLRDGLPVSDPVGLFVELGTLLTIDDLVAVGDALVLDPEVLDPRDPRPWITHDELRRGVGAHPRTPGLAAARRALALVRVGAESRPESLLRLLLIRAGLPEPELNQILFDSRDRRLGRFDLVYREARVIVEYDGDQHRTSTVQYDRDIRRLERAREASWAVVQVRARGLLIDPADTVSRVRRALARPRA